MIFNSVGIVWVTLAIHYSKYCKNSKKNYTMSFCNMNVKFRGKTLRKVADYRVVTISH
jgi:hypothetical protein